MKSILDSCCQHQDEQTDDDLDEREVSGDVYGMRRLQEDSLGTGDHPCEAV